MDEIGLINPRGSKGDTMDQPDLNPLFKTGSIIDEKWVLIERIGKGGMGGRRRAFPFTGNPTQPHFCCCSDGAFFCDGGDQRPEVEAVPSARTAAVGITWCPCARCF